jgi:hypothetical protein
VVKTLEGLVGELHFEVVAEAALRCEGEACRDLPEQPPERAGSSKLESGERGDQDVSLRRVIRFIVRERCGRRVTAGSRRFAAFLVVSGGGRGKTAGRDLEYDHSGR